MTALIVTTSAVNPHGWQDFGDFAADAGLGAVIFCALLIAWAVWLNRKGGDE